MFRGIGASDGIGIGKIIKIEDKEIKIPEKQITDVNAECQRFLDAVDVFVEKTMNMAEDMRKRVGEKEAERIYNNMDLLVLPSIWKETFGMVVLEALSYGVPVIISENVGAKELLTEHENMGVVIKPTADTLQETLTEIYRNREILERMNRAICNWEKQFCYEDHVKKIMDLYHTVVGAES